MFVEIKYVQKQVQLIQVILNVTNLYLDVLQMEEDVLHS